MGKYWSFFKLRLQTTLLYRGSVIIFRLSNIILLLTLIAVWLSASSNGLIAGYTTDGLITYYLVGMLLNSIVFWHSTPAITADIVDGQLGAKALSKPVSYYWQKFFEELGWHTVSPFFGLISVLLVAFFIRGSLQLPPTILASALLLISTALASILFFNLSSCLGLLAFWFTQTEGITSFVWTGVFLLGGQSLPVSFFPPYIIKLIELLPFRYIYSFPLEIYFGRLAPLQLLHGFIVQIFWLIVLGLLYRLLWRRGLKHYSAYGG